MGKFHDHRFPGESDDYRRVRDELLEAEIRLRQQLEAVAALRRQLPVSGPIKEDYVFDEDAAELNDRHTTKRTKLSDLFGDKDTLVVYSLMFAPDWEKPCRSCNSILDGINGSAPHINDRVSFVVVSKASIEKLRDWARSRHWHNLRLLSSAGNDYNHDYFAESSEHGQLPALNVFRNVDGQIFHFYNTELLYTVKESGQDGRHVDLIWPIWNIFDLCPEGRGTSWYPKFEY